MNPRDLARVAKSAGMPQRHRAHAETERLTHRLAQPGQDAPAHGQRSVFSDSTCSRRSAFFHQVFFISRFE